ncbi:MAG: Hpt domain-containing protein, partial [Leptospira sp.]|nr:Hpt domain-containing protein [Leptospira sp.]
MSGILGEYTEAFLEESEDQIEELNSNLLIFEKDHNNREIINDIFRAAHSLKSSAGFVGLYNLSELAHKMENLLQNIRENKLNINVTLVNLLFECFDLIKDVIQAVARGEKKDTPFTEMIGKLENYEKSHSQESPQKESPSPVLTVPKTDFKSENIILDEDEEKEVQEELKESKQKAYNVSIRLKRDTPMKGLRFTLILQNIKEFGSVYKSSPDSEQLERGTDTDILSLLFLTDKSEEEIRAVTTVDMIDAVSVSLRTMRVLQGGLPTLPEKKESMQQEKDSDSKVLSKSIKVSSEKLDQLMNNVGELVITNSAFQKIYDDMIATFGDDILFSELKSKIDQINRISKDLQSGIMNTRMVPVGSVFGRFSRLVRDLSLDTEKKVELILRGENTELDKKVVDVIGEPLMHLIRNSIDHGIETPAERLKAGKPEAGKIRLNAYQGGNYIMVEISDDGKGLDKNRILQK